MPAGVGAMISSMTGHSPFWGALAGEISHILGRNVPDAARLSLLKFLGSTGPVDASAWKAMVDYAEMVSNGQKSLSKQAKNVFMPLATSMIAEPSEKDREKLTRQLVDFQNNPEKHFQVGMKLQEGMTDHSSAASMYALGAVQYLNGLRPNTQKTLPLDGKVIANPVQKAAYDRALNIAQKPLIVFDAVKSGTVTPQDVTTLKTIFPPLYEKMSEELTHNLIEHSSKDQDVPYVTRLGLSTFLGQPLDSTMTPQSIAATQNLVAPQQMQGQTIPGQRAKHSFTALNKMPGMYQTPQQARTAHKLGS